MYKDRIMISPPYPPARVVGKYENFAFLFMDAFLWLHHWLVLNYGVPTIVQILFRHFLGQVLVMYMH